MAKTKVTKVEHTVKGVYLEVVCPVKDKKVMVKISPYDFSHSDSPCDLCGSHGHFSVDYTCPECGQRHEHFFSKW